MSPDDLALQLKQSDASRSFMHAALLLQRHEFVSTHLQARLEEALAASMDWAARTGASKSLRPSHFCSVVGSGLTALLP